MEEEEEEEKEKEDNGLEVGFASVSGDGRAATLLLRRRCVPASPLTPSSATPQPCQFGLQPLRLRAHCHHQHQHRCHCHCRRSLIVRRRRNGGGGGLLTLSIRRSSIADSKLECRL